MKTKIANRNSNELWRIMPNADCGSRRRMPTTSSSPLESRVSSRPVLVLVRTWNLEFKNALYGSAIRMKRRARARARSLDYQDDATQRNASQRNVTKRERESEWRREKKALRKPLADFRRRMKEKFVSFLLRGTMTSAAAAGRGGESRIRKMRKSDRRISTRYTYLPRTQLLYS